MDDAEAGRNSATEGGMMKASLTLQKEHLNELQRQVFNSDGAEGVAYLLCGSSSITADPWRGEPERRLLSYDVAPAEDVVSASPTHITWRTDSFVQLLKRAQTEKLAVGIVHSHPNGFAQFSEQDDRNEPGLLELAQHRNGGTTTLLSLLLTPDTINARLWSKNGEVVPLSMIRTIGPRIGLDYERGQDVETPEVWDRQALAFGAALNTDLHNLQIGIVGCGGTGSAVAMLLGRLGVGRIALFDQDIVKETNLNRMHGATMDDARIRRSKAEVIKQAVEGTGLGTHVTAYPSWIGEEQCRDAMKACDVLFGCTDDHDGRLLLNRFAYFYLVPVFDMGLVIDVSQEEIPRIHDLSGRVTVLRPGTPCLICRRVVNPVTAREEHLRRTSPEEYERQKDEAYVVGEGNPNPAVVTFTTEVATLAVNTLLHHLNGFREPARDRTQWVRRFHRMEDRPVGARQAPDCPVCFDRSYWGRGDIDPFLDRVG